MQEDHVRPEPEGPGTGALKPIAHPRYFGVQDFL